MRVKKSSFLLVATALLGLLLILVGLWEWAVAGALHSLIGGSVTLAVTGLARWFQTRRPRPTSGDKAAPVLATAKDDQARGEAA